VAAYNVAYSGVGGVFGGIRHQRSYQSRQLRLLAFNVAGGGWRLAKWRRIVKALESLWRKLSSAAPATNVSNLKQTGGKCGSAEEKRSGWRLTQPFRQLFEMTIS